MSENLEYYEKEIVSKLYAFRDKLADDGIRSELTIDSDEVPGLLIFMQPFDPLYLTFADEMNDGTMIIRLSMDALDEDGMTVDDIITRNFYLMSEGYPKPDELKEFVKILISGKAHEVYPLSTTKLQESGALIPMVDNLAMNFLESGAQEAEAIYEPIPCVLVVDDEISFISTFEAVGNKYLLHFRADIPYDESEDEESIRAVVDQFNASNRFAICSLGCEDMGIIDESGKKVITLHACTLDNGDGYPHDFYGYFGALFEGEVENFIDMWIK